MWKLNKNLTTFLASLVCTILVFTTASGQDLSEIPSDLSFSCNGRAYGYYADVSTNCKVFHICLGDGDVKWSFLCPNQTSFHQQYFVCDYDGNVDCKSAESYYTLNDNFGQVIPSSSTEQQPQKREQKPVVELEQESREESQPFEQQQQLALESQQQEIIQEQPSQQQQQQYKQQLREEEPQQLVPQPQQIQEQEQPQQLVVEEPVQQEYQQQFREEQPQIEVVQQEPEPQQQQQQQQYQQQQQQQQQQQYQQQRIDSSDEANADLRSIDSTTELDVRQAFL